MSPCLAKSHPPTQDIAWLCAEAAAIHIDKMYSQGWPYYFDSGLGDRGSVVRYDPANNDAQCFALIRDVNLDVRWLPGGHKFKVSVWNSPSEPEAFAFTAYNLNRAVVECVARMQAAKQ